MISKKAITALCFILLLTSAIANIAAEETSVGTPVPNGLNGSISTDKFDITKEKVLELKKTFSELQGVPEEEIARYDKITTQILSDLDKIAELNAQKQQYIQAQKSAQSDFEKLEKALAEFQDFSREDQKVEGIDLASAESTLSQVQADYDLAKKTSSDLEVEPQRRAKRLTEIPALISKNQEDLAAINQKIAANSKQDLENTTAYIELIKSKVDAELAKKRIDTLQQELKAYEATKNLLPLQRDFAAKQLNKFDKKIKFWQETVNRLRKNKLEEIKQEVKTAVQKVEYSSEAAKNVAKEISELTQTQSKLLKTIESTTQYQQVVSDQLKEIKDDFSSTEKLIKESEKVTSTMGMLLITKKESLPDIKQNLKSIKKRFEQISTAQLKWQNYDEKWSKLLDIEDTAVELLEKSGVNSSSPYFKDHLDELKTLLTQKRKILRIITGYYSDYFTLLAQLDAQERDLVNVVEKYDLFISKNILWVKSGSSFNKDEFRNSLIAMKSIYTEKLYNTIWIPVSRDIKNNYVSYSLCLILAVLLLALRKWFINKIKIYSAKIKRTDTDRFSHTANTIFLSIAASLPATILLVFITWRYSLTAAMSNDLSSMLGAFKTVTFITFIFFILRWFTIDNGLGSHLKFDRKMLMAFRYHIVWLYIAVILLTLMYSLLQGSDIELEVKNAGLRFLFIIEQIAICIFLIILFKPGSDFAIRLQEAHTGKSSKNLRYFWFFVIISVPLIFCVISIIGYRHAALYLHYRLAETVLFYLAIIFCNRLLMRRLYISRRKLALRKMAEKKEIQSSQADGPEMVPASLRIEEINDSILNISKQTKQIINVISTFVVVVGIWWIWKSTLPALEAFEQIQIGQTVDKSGVTTIITLGSAIKAIIVLILTLFTAKNIPGLMEITILQKLRFNSGARFAFTSLSKYLIFAIGFIYSFSSLGIKWETVQWLVAAVTVGLGFGLQEIFANFVSGLMILFEQPIRVGDYVTIGDISGEVTQIRIRATTIVKWDRKELLVPNKEFITGRLINWTLTDQILRLEFHAGIAYGSDIKKAESLLYEIAAKCKQVIHEDPKPRVIFKAFGASSLDFELRVYITNIKDYLDVWHAINCEIDTVFRKNGIEIAFPQSDLHLKSINFDLPFSDPKKNSDKNIADLDIEKPD